MGGVTGALFTNPVSFIVMFIGVFLFGSVPQKEVFCDYVLANSEEIIAIKRYYFNILILQIAFSILTLGIVNANIRIPWKEKYFKGTVNHIKEDLEKNRISSKEYIAIRNEQRRIYSGSILSKEFMERSYTVEAIGFKRKKRRLIVVCVLAALVLLGFVEPKSIYLVCAYELIFIPMIILWVPAYKDAKIIQQAYERAMKNYI